MNVKDKYVRIIDSDPVAATLIRAVLADAAICDRGGRMRGAEIALNDASIERPMMLNSPHLAQHDVLTNLPNRLLLNDRLTQSISLARRRRKQLAVLILNVDNFKNINDAMGYLIGDKLLQSIAQRLMTCVRDSDTVSHQRGDEFVVLLPDVINAMGAGCRAAKILVALAEKHCINEHDINITLSIGISVFPDDGESAEILLKHADAAMHHARKNGGNNYQFFKQDSNNRAVERKLLEGNLLQALARQEFILHYQPKVNLQTGAITGAEALIHWQHPVRGLLCPEQFVAIAEDSGLMVQIGKWRLHEACRQAQAWKITGRGPIPVAVNISAAEFRSEDLLADIHDILMETGLDPRYLEIELNESVLVQDVESTLTVLHALKAMGVQLVIDDFGTGYSSLSFLRQLPVDTLKIDQSFVRNIDNVSGDATIVSAVIGMGNSFNFRVSAGGVETREQVAFLQAERCEEGQGYYFSPPVDAVAFIELRGWISTKYAANRQLAAVV